MTMPAETAHGSAIDELRLALSKEDADTCDEATLARFLRAEKGHVKTAATRLTAQLKWQREERPGEQACSSCARDPRSHYFHPVGYTKCGQPVLYSCLALASDRGPASNREHMIATFEQAIRLMPAGVEKWVWFSDLRGFGMRDLNPAVAHTFLELASRHYPERLGTFYLVDAPSIFTLLWNALQPFIDPATRTKIRLIPYDVAKKNSSLRAAIEEHFEAALVPWVLAEMEDNRIKARVKAKQYSQAAVMHALRTDGHLEPHWGCSSFLEQLRRKPELLAP